MLALLATLALAHPVITVGDREIPDPHRWLEEADDPAVVEWASARTAEAVAWLDEGEGVERALAWLAAHGAVEREVEGITTHRGGTSVWWVHGAPQDPARATRGATRFFVERAGVRSELAHPRLDPEQPPCPTRVSRDGAAVVWGRRISEVDTRCRLFLTDLDTGASHLLFEGEEADARFVPDGDRLLVGHVDGGRGVVTEIARDGEVLGERLRGRRMLVAEQDEEGRVLAVAWGRAGSRARARPWRRTRSARFFVGSFGELERVATGRLRLAGVAGRDLVLVEDTREGGRVVRIDPSEPDVVHEVLPADAKRPIRDALLRGEELVVLRSVDGARSVESVALAGGDPAASGIPPAPDAWLRRGGDGVVLVITRSPAAGSTSWWMDGQGPPRRLDGGRPTGRIFETVYGTSADGTDVPASVTRPAGAARDGDRPVLIDVYGGFGLSSAQRDTPELAWIVAHGGLHVVVHARGGGERGTAWHEGGRLENLRNTLDDVVAVAEHLIAEGWTRPGRIALTGSSNGGLTTAATVAARPDLFGAALTEAGVHDLLRGPRFGLWWPAEYGRSSQAGQGAVLAALSPVHAAPEAPLPPVWIATGREDPVVSPAHSYKLAASWRELPGGPVHLRVLPFATHARGRLARANADLGEDVVRRAAAERLAFIARALGLDPAPPEPSGAVGAPDGRR